MKKRSYKITCCLSSGYSGTGVSHSFADVEKTIESWMNERLSQQLPTVSGFLQQGTLIFPARGRRLDGKTVSSEPSVQFVGELSSESDLSRSDDEIKNTLISLAQGLKESLRQEKVFILFNKENWFI